MGDQDPKAESSPLYGATPPPTSGSSTTTSQSVPISNGSSPEIKVPDHSKTTNPLFGATPPAQVSIPPRIPTRTRLPLHHPSTLPAYLRRLGYILSLVLGSSAVIAGIWSAFILPLLHSSFSARKALVDQQKDRWTDLLKGLREVRAKSIYPAPTEETACALPITKHESQEKLDLEEKEEARLIDHEEINSIEYLLPLTPVVSLSQTLRDLVTAFTSTSTTRTSLLSTLESYTSHLHRQLYLRNHPISFGGGSKYGLNTLSDNLAKAGGKSTWSAFDQSEGDSVGLESVGVKSEEWDAVRKEVRAIKGMLLSRRNFMTESESR